MNVMTQIGSVDGDLGVVALATAAANLVREDGKDLSLRQLAIFLRVYTTAEPQTVRGLAEALRISRPAVTRALDRLGDIGFAERRPDPRDRRSVHVARTPRGTDFARRVRAIMESAMAGSAA